MSDDVREGEADGDDAESSSVVHGAETSWETRDAEAYYDDLADGEWERLDRDAYHRLEWDGTVDYLDRHLPDSGRVLDAGGAAGRYAVWLAERGHEVTLVDVSEEQLRIARERVAERGLADRVSVERGDVRDLDFEDGAFDATLCLGGPLSHVLDPDERETAVSELARVTEPDAPVFVSVMGRLAMVQATIQALGDDDVSEGMATMLPEFARTGDYDRDLRERHGVDPTAFTAHFFRVAELEDLLESGGLRVETVAGLEGVASVRRVAADDLDDASAEIRGAVTETVDILREDRTVADLSTHVLAVARAGE